MGPAVVDLVVFNDHQTRDGSQKCDVVESGVSVRALLFLLRGVRGLEDEDALNEEEHGGGVKELRKISDGCKGRLDDLTIDVLDALRTA